MITLDEAIKQCDEIADYDCYSEKQMKRAEEYRQLAEWLKELKEFRSFLGTVESARWLYESWERYGEVTK